MKTIEIIITKDGEVTIDAISFVGTECEAATFALEKAFGKTASKRLKPEYHRQQNPNKAVQR